jgi:hypothetical protein
MQSGLLGQLFGTWPKSILSMPWQQATVKYTAEHYLTWIKYTIGVVAQYNNWPDESTCLQGLDNEFAVGVRHHSWLVDATPPMFLKLHL